MFVRILATRCATKVDVVRPSPLVCVHLCWCVRVCLPKYFPQTTLSYQYIAYKVVPTCLPQCFINNSIDSCPQVVFGVADTCCIRCERNLIMYTFLVCACMCMCVYVCMATYKLLLCVGVFQHTSTSKPKLLAFGRKLGWRRHVWLLGV